MEEYNWYREAARCMKFLCDEKCVDEDNARGMVSYICDVIIKRIDTVDEVDKDGKTAYDIKLRHSYDMSYGVVATNKNDAIKQAKEIAKEERRDDKLEVIGVESV